MFGGGSIRSYACLEEVRPMVLPNILVVDGDPALLRELAELLAEHARVT